MGKITDYGLLASPQADDLLLAVDVHDTSMDPAGTTKGIPVGMVCPTLGSNTAAVLAVLVSTTAETVVASLPMPAGMPAKTSFRITAWGSISIGGTGGTFVSKTRVGGLGGVQIASASSGAFSAGGTGFWLVDAVVTLQVPGVTGTWSGFDRQQESVSGTNSNSIGAGTAAKDSTVSQLLAVTVAMSSATSSASCLGALAERTV
jgi:hypothetical protein